MSKPKIWKIKGYEGSFTDEEIVYLIKSGRLDENFRITTKDIKEWIRVKDSIYEFYLKGDKKDETL